MMEMMDRAAVMCMINPDLHPALTDEDVTAWNLKHPDEMVEDKEELRSDEVLYVDELDDEDKSFIFQWLTGGTSDLEQFRKQQSANVATLEAS